MLYQFLDKYLGFISAPHGDGIAILYSAIPISMIVFAYMYVCNTKLMYVYNGLLTGIQE